MGNYQPNIKGLGEVLLGPEIRAALAAVGEKAKAAAEADADTFRSDEAHEHYADAFELRDETIEFQRKSYGPSTRAAAVVVNTKSYAAVVEVGNGKYPARRVLGKALASLEAKS
jgi:hypothetical protein